MSWKLFVIFILANLSAVLSAPPVFLESAGSKICTLNNVGKVPTGTAISYPVYKKVCRQVIPRLGDEVNDDEVNAEDETVTSSDDEVDKVRRAILGKSKGSHGSGRKNLKSERFEIKLRLPQAAIEIPEPIRLDAVVSN